MAPWGRSWVKNPAQAPAPPAAALDRCCIKRGQNWTISVSAELKLLEMQRMGKALLKSWVLTVGNQTKWPIIVYFDPKGGDILNFKPILVENC